MARLNYTYIIESGSTGNWYYGSSHDPHMRLNQHNANSNNSTKRKGPWKLIFIRSFIEKKEALVFERQLKKCRNKSFIQSGFKNYFI